MSSCFDVDMAVFSECTCEGSWNSCMVAMCSWLIIKDGFVDNAHAISLHKLACQ